MSTFDTFEWHVRRGMHACFPPLAGGGSSWAEPAPALAAESGVQGRARLLEFLLPLLRLRTMERTQHWGHGCVERRMRDGALAGLTARGLLNRAAACSLQQAS